MSAVLELPTSRTVTNVAALVDELGGIPLERIRVQPPLGTATESDLIEFNSRKEGLCELLEGCLVYKEIVIESLQTAEAPETLAQLSHLLGDIPLERVRMQPAPGTATEDDLIWINDQGECLCELVDGVLVEKAVAFLEALLASHLIARLVSFAERTRLGKVFAPDALFRVLTGRVRLPDVSFVESRHFPGGKVKRVAIGEMPIALAVEILSPSNTRREITQKRREYFESGTRLMWVADPGKRTVAVYTSIDESVVLTEDDVLDGGSVLPGFELSVRDWFEEAENV